MTEAAIEARRKYRREWARKNRDKVRATEQRYWEKVAQAAAAEAPADAQKAAED